MKSRRRLTAPVSHFWKIARHQKLPHDFRREAADSCGVPMANKDRTIADHYRATNNFDVALVSVWNEISQIPQLRKFPADRLKKELFFLWQVGGNYLRQPSRPERLRRCIEAGDRVGNSLDAYLSELTKLIHNYSLEDFYAVYRAHPVYGTALDDILSLPKLASELIDLRADIGIATELFSGMPGLRTSNSGELSLRRKGTVDALANIAHIAMKSWRLLTGKQISFAKGIERPEGSDRAGTVGAKLRPLQDDVYFAFLCMKLACGLEDPSKAITAVNRARDALNKYQRAVADDVSDAKAAQHKVDFHEKYDDEMRRTIYGLEY